MSPIPLPAKLASWGRLIVLAVLLIAGSASLHAEPAPPAHAAEEQEAGKVRRTLDALYEAFSFDAGGAPDWEGLRSLFLPGAAFVDPVKPGVPPKGIGADAFLANFRNWVETNPKAKAGFRERIVAARVDHFGHLAHAYVTFEGYVPGATTAETRGLDSIQLVLDGDLWKVASFTTQYEEPGLPLPGRFRTP